MFAYVSLPLSNRREWNEINCLHFVVHCPANSLYVHFKMPQNGKNVFRIALNCHLFRHHRKLFIDKRNVFKCLQLTISGFSYVVKYRQVNLVRLCDKCRPSKRFEWQKARKLFTPFFIMFASNKSKSITSICSNNFRSFVWNRKRHSFRGDNCRVITVSEVNERKNQRIAFSKNRLPLPDFFLSLGVSLKNKNETIFTNWIPMNVIRLTAIPIVCLWLCACEKARDSRKGEIVWWTNEVRLTKCMCFLRATS